METTSCLCLPCWIDVISSSLHQEHLQLSDVASLCANNMHISYLHGGSYMHVHIATTTTTATQQYLLLLPHVLLLLLKHSCASQQSHSCSNHVKKQHTQLTAFLALTANGEDFLSGPLLNKDSLKDPPARFCARRRSRIALTNAFNSSVLSIAIVTRQPTATPT